MKDGAPDLVSSDIFIPKPPERLTRFYGTVDYAVDVFKASAISFIHVSLMNDPFDPYFEFSNNFGLRYQALRQWVRKNQGQVAENSFMKIMTYEGWEKIKRDVLSKNRSLKENTFLFCASAPTEKLQPYENLYMWGHYGAGHKGLAIEFDAEKVARDVYRHHSKINPTLVDPGNIWTPVIYSDIIDPITPADCYEVFIAPGHEVLNSKIARVLNTVSRTKSTVWRLENEWRLLWRNDDRSHIYQVPVRPDAIHRIYLGMRMAPEVVRELVALCSSNFPHVEILRGAARPGEFALDFRQV
jgi:hypothetical protein